MLNRKQLIILWIAAIVVALQDLFILFYRDEYGARFIETRYILLWALPVICIAIPLIISLADQIAPSNEPSPAWNGVERRKYKRANDRRLQVEYRLYARGDELRKESWRGSYVEDISAGGARFIAREKFELNDILELKIHMYSAKGDLNCFGRVLRLQPTSEKKFHYVGVRFQ